MRNNLAQQSVNMETPTDTPSNYISKLGSHPAVYELRRSISYHGLSSPSNCSPFINFPTDALYQFPLIDGQPSPNEMLALISSSLLTYTKSIDMNTLLENLHNNSPFKKTSQYSRIRIQQTSNLYEDDSQYFDSREDNILDESYLEQSSEIIQNVSSKDYTPIDEEAIKLIQQIQRNFHSRPENENNLQSLTPVSNETSQLSKYTQNCSEINIEDNLIRENSEFCVEDEKSYQEKSLKLGTSEEFCSSLPEEGPVQTIKWTMEFEESASKNILSSYHYKPELIKLSPKSLGSMNSPYTSLVQEVSSYHPTSPILRKLIFCQVIADSSDSLEIVSSVATTGFSTALCLEYSNIDIQNKASVDYKRAYKILINNSIAKAIAKNKAIWLSCGFEHCALVTCEGKVMTWGYGASGCLGHGDTNSYGFPKLIKSISGETCKYIECGGYHTLAITENCEVFMWGRGDVHQLGLPYRQLCKDEHGHVALRPTKLDFLKKKIKGGACGEAHTLILDEDGAIFAFGWGEDGQLGISANNFEEGKSKGITQINFSFGSNVIKVAAGHTFSVCLTEFGEIFVWGNGEKGQFAREIESEFLFIPQKIEIGKVIDVVCGESSVICATENGYVYGWGLGKAGYFSIQSQNFSVGSELVCFSPKLLGEADIIHHYLL